MSPRRLLANIFIGLLLCGTLIALIFVSPRSSPPEPRVEQGVFGAVGELGKEAPTPVISPRVTKGAAILYPAPMPIPESVEPESIPEFVRDGLALLEQKLPRQPLPNFTSVGSAVPALLPDYTPPGPMSPLITEEEVFQRVWTPSYLAHLKRIENTTITPGDDQGGEVLNGAVKEWAIPVDQRTSLSTDEEVYKTLLNVTQEAYENGWITREQLDDYKRGITEILPQIIQQEKALIRKGENPQGILPAGQRFLESSSIAVLAKDFLDGLAYIFRIVEPANAAWVRGDDCYKDDDPSNNTRGFNGSTFCCNCGLHCHPCKFGCCWHFHKDCGEQATECQIHFGCLNAVCKDWPNAIWDKETSICGCG